MPFKRTSSGPHGASKDVKKQHGSSSQAPDPEHEMEEVDLSTMPQEQWPENNLPYRGIKWDALVTQCRKNFEHFQKRKFVRFRYLDVMTMHTLDIYDKVKLILSEVRLWDVLISEQPTYRTLTLEFLSSFEFDELDRVMCIKF
jgi:ATHILA ORF-1 family